MDVYGLWGAGAGVRPALLVGEETRVGVEDTDVGERKSKGRRRGKKERGYIDADRTSLR